MTSFFSLCQEETYEFDNCFTNGRVNGDSWIHILVNCNFIYGRF